MDVEVLLRAYLAVWFFCTAVASGSVGVLLLQRLTPGVWGKVVEAPLERAAALLPILELLAVPIAIGAPQLYGEGVSIIAFALRLAFYFAVWIALAYAVRHVHWIGAPGIIAFTAVTTFAVWDVLMALQPQWSSTIFAPLIIVTSATAALAVAIVIAAFRGTDAGPDAIHDVGNLLLTAALLTTYLGFSQFLIVWNANLPEEVAWYLPRTTGAAGFVAFALLIGHVAIPLPLLLPRIAKRRLGVIGFAAALIALLQFVHITWMVVG